MDQLAVATEGTYAALTHAEPARHLLLERHLARDAVGPADGLQQLVALPGLVDEVLGRRVLQLVAQTGGIEIDAVDPGHDLAAGIGKLRPDRVQLGDLYDPRPQSRDGFAG